MLAPDPLVDIGDADWEVLLDVLEADAVDDVRSDATPGSWLIDDETLTFLGWNGLSERTVQALRTRFRPDGFVEVVWEEMGRDR